MSRRLIALSLVALFATPAAAQAPNATAMALQPHRIAYEMSLAPGGSGSAFQSARGLMVLEFTGSACDGYATNFRQVTELVGSDGDARRLDFRVNLWEQGEGKSFRFTMRNAINGTVSRDADGEATRRRDGSVAVIMKKPRGQKSDFDGDITFPSAMTLALLDVARKGGRSFEKKLFDGSENGEKAFDVIGIIGAPLEGERNARLEGVLKGGTLDAVRRWPVTLSYFEEGQGDRTPVYRMRTVTFENGVMGDITFEFPEFSLAAKAVKYEALPLESCKR